MKEIQDLKTAHVRAYGDSPRMRVFACPGRINIIGEHIDYNGGHVLPAAVNKHVYLAITPNNDNVIRFHSVDFGDPFEIHVDNIDDMSDPGDHWWVYPFGACKLIDIELKSGFDLTFKNTLPAGAGMSSSAAITVCTIYALCMLHNASIKPNEMARLAQRVEWEVAGVSCGIMDQFSVIHGKEDNAIMLDTRDLSFEFVPVDSNVVHFVLVNSGIKHSLKDTGYNDRRKECQHALETLQAGGIKIDHLCELPAEKIDVIKGMLSDVEFKRTVHAVTENLRVKEFSDAMNAYRLHEAGDAMFRSHASLRDDFEVSIPEIDRMVKWTKDIDGVYGSRMMGGGFGGCTINMVALYAVDRFTDQITKKFEAEFGRAPEIYNCILEDGVRELVGSE
ncbi:MAG: galactokinase [Spirochaetota bacterium]